MAASEKDGFNPQFRPGHLLAQRYRVRTLLGLGGMSEVYDAYDEKRDHGVALKILPRARTRSKEQVERFRRQALAALQIRHPGIVEVYDWGNDNGTYFVVMERLVGSDLGQRIVEGMPFSFAFVTKVAVQMARAAHAAHRTGVIHRDLKPANVFLVQSDDGNESVKLLDFGVAKLQADASFTYTEQIMGTPAYMAPEQLQSAKYVDARADVYAIGCIIYEMLTGRPPFTASNKMELMLMVTNDRAEPIECLRAEVPRELIRIIEKAMAKDPAERFASAALLANALQRLGIS
ncbi:MAG: serine/threonine protein kinase [Deltaproteobacteria bacterium]|nr:serine/threonine protein kinase [Deltaproteobacteria bacterium]